MRAWLLMTLIFLTVGPAGAENLSDFPSDSPIPIPVSVGVRLIKLEEIQEAEGTFSATLDVRLAWTDPRLKSARQGQFGSRAARASLETIWNPGVQLQNLRGQESDNLVDEALWISEQGEVEWIRRLRGSFEASFDTSNFPFDRQDLSLIFLGNEYDRNQIALVSDQAAQRFAQGKLPEIPGWEMRRGAVTSSLESHWNGNTHSRIAYEFSIRRDPWRYVAPIFTPVLATLLVPVLAVWLNRWGENTFQIEAYEFMSLAVGGLFATIALTLAVYSSYPFLSSGRNVVGHLFTLNYLLLATAGLVILGLFRSQRQEKPVLSPGVAYELYQGVCWAIPAAALIAAAAIFFTALP